MKLILTPDATFVFHDAGGRRWPRIKRVLFGLGLLLFLALLLFVRFLLIRPELRLPPAVLHLRAQLQGLRQSTSTRQRSGPNSSTDVLRHTATLEKRTHRPREQGASTEGNILLAFYRNEDKRGWASLQRNVAQLTHLSPEWLFLRNEERELELKNVAEVESLAAAHDVKLVPLLTNFFQGWRGDLIEALVTGPVEEQDAFIRSAVALARKHRYAGINVDFEEVSPDYGVAFNDFLIRFAKECHRNGLQFFLCVPMGLDAQVFDLDRLAEHVDFFVAMLYDENSRYDKPGPVASQPWFERWLKHVLDFGEPRQWIIGLGSFGYDWSEADAVGHTISFGDAMALGSSAPSATVASIAPELNPTFAYEEGNIRHEVWFLDAVTVLNQARAVVRANPAGMGLWRLGVEDPSVWEAFRLARKRNLTRDDTRVLEHLDPEDHATHVGTGEIVKARLEQVSGSRALARDANGVYSERYRNFPSYVVLEHYGETNPNWVALTFDDGPDGRWTPKILDILKAKRVPATFFVVGDQAEKHPELIVRMMREGHEIGNHTYYHPNVAEISEVRVDAELNATQRLIESILGRSTVLFRPPYMADSRPQTLTDIMPILRAQKFGYVTLCENIDPEDWSRPGAHEILERVQEQRAEGSVILLHDGGGDRSQTVEALPQIIDWLRRQGPNRAQFVTASKLLGVGRDVMMPPALHSDRTTIAATSFGLWTVHFLEEMLWAFMIVASVMVLIRTSIIAVFAILQKRRTRLRLAAPSSQVNPAAWPPISVVIAALNEERVIVGTIQSVLENGYPGEMEVLVVDDGSTDGTGERIQSRYGSDPRVRLFSQPNHGKAIALGRALGYARHALVISLDADTHPAPGAIEELVRSFLNAPEVGAVSGNVKVGNRGRWLTEFQSLEYICGFNLDRRAYDWLQCITVVPGAISAYRKSAIDAVGGFTPETLAEDTDLTLKIHRGGWEVRYSEKAVGWTESPETLQTLFKQRFRWAFGTLQCLWKHRDALFNPRFGTLGWFALPSMWFFQILLVAASPLVDVLMILSLVAGNGVEVLLFFLAFIATDIVLAALALRLEGESLWRVAWVLPQRLMYRPLLCVVIWSAIRRALHGSLVGWSKFERTASVRVSEAS
jgi:cellulose synthase/poly-beta-1,6-N-acetylglucosamine synthase-like glycosyltransferase/peptidoglycan/xylan/chitin deacetylase (PgdA/CDA1 family)/spore germination protein YaaH